METNNIGLVVTVVILMTAFAIVFFLLTQQVLDQHLSEEGYGYDRCQSFTSVV